MSFPIFESIYRESSTDCGATVKLISFSSLSDSLHYDFCPSMNVYVYWLKKPIGWLAVALVASVLLGIFVSRQSFLAAAAIASLGLIGCIWPWIAMAGLRGQLSWSQMRCEEGETVETSLRITNRWPWPVWGLVVEADDAISSQIDAPEEPICLSRVTAMAHSSFLWKCRPELRGVYPRKKIRLTTAFPFGIWTCGREIEAPTKLIVWPRVVKLSDVPERSGSMQSAVGSSSSQMGNEGDWMGVRPYREGDSLRQVHWAQTARRDSLVVFERQSHSRQQVSVWLDPVSSVKCNGQQREWLIRIFATVSLHFAKHGWDVCGSIDGNWTPVHSSSSGQQAWLDQLAHWQPRMEYLNDLSGASNRRRNKIFIICSAARVLPLLEHFKNNGEDLQWVVLEDGSEPAKPDVIAPSVNQLQIDDGGNHAEQMRTEWSRYCQRALQVV